MKIEVPKLLFALHVVLCAPQDTLELLHFSVSDALVSSLVLVQAS